MPAIFAPVTMAPWRFLCLVTYAKPASTRSDAFFTAAAIFMLFFKGAATFAFCSTFVILLRRTTGASAGVSVSSVGTDEANARARTVGGRLQPEHGRLARRNFNQQAILTNWRLSLRPFVRNTAPTPPGPQPAMWPASLSSRTLLPPLRKWWARSRRPRVRPSKECYP